MSKWLLSFNYFYFAVNTSVGTRRPRCYTQHNWYLSGQVFQTVGHRADYMFTAIIYLISVFTPVNVKGLLLDLINTGTCPCNHLTITSVVQRLHTSGIIDLKSNPPFSPSHSSPNHYFKTQNPEAPVWMNYQFCKWRRHKANNLSRIPSAAGVHVDTKTAWSCMKLKYV